MSHATASSPLVMALDQGTHASRALVFDRRGTLLASGSRPVGLTRPEPDWVEQDGEEIVVSVREAAQQALRALGERRGDVAAVGLAIQRSSSLCWDRESGIPLSPVISWQDRRTHYWLRRLEPHAEAIHRKTGLFLSPHYGASKLRWCLDNLPPVRRARAAGRLCWGPLASYVAFRLLRERPHAVDPQCASRTHLWNLAERDWDADLLGWFGVPREVLPRSVPTFHPYGTLELEGVAIPWTAMNGDATAGLYAAGPPEPESAYVTMGTGAFVLRALERLPGHAPRLLRGILAQEGSLAEAGAGGGPGTGTGSGTGGDRSAVQYMLEGSVNGAGAALSWLAEELEMDDVLAHLPEWLERPPEVQPQPKDAAGRAAPPDSAPLLFLNGVSGLASPFWQADFRPRFVGHGKPWEQAVAVVESIAFLVQANLDEMAGRVTPPVRLRVTGGVAQLDGLCRRMAALSGLPVLRREDPEGTARGIAYLAAGRPAEWDGGGGEARFEPGADARFATGADAPVRERYRRWRETMAQLTGI